MTERPASPHASPHQSPHAAHAAAERTPRGVQSVKFTFYRLPNEARRLSSNERAALGTELESLLVESGEAMLTRVYTTAGTRGDHLASTQASGANAHSKLTSETDHSVGAGQLLLEKLGGLLVE